LRAATRRNQRVRRRARRRRAGSARPAVQQTPAPTAASVDPQQAFVNQYCVVCHNQRLKTGGLVLESLDITQVGPQAETWEKVVRKIKTGLMPPAGARRPDRTALDGFAAQLEGRLDRAVAPNANLSTPALHRLNRTEYANAIRDLLDLDIDVSTLLPATDPVKGSTISRKR
jgi:mono/diheme cytochrome c family protein